ncbi:hypothetical protein SAMN05192529_11276 [Arachidicoccus rhizosphaerae]|uniref:HEAT repeat-containing protein n=1 Tax=Arachidicoccus rhizosphaerae TaxID=551991 RepID=A0A1H3ZW88_9BACT|nr:hypothetical protein [Arachidicoccus rhizosphaerae]SEA27967.1 hypothetical protein SAMN05192529_11276 [Arachidicoccus rhizosphaerae]
MNITEYLNILRKPDKLWLFSRERTAEKINALAIIAARDEPAFIYYLIDLLKSNNKEVREAISRTIIHLFKQIKHKNEYYNTLKNCNIFKSDLHYFEAEFSKEVSIELLAISSLNGNGHIREEAVKKLAQAKHIRAVPFLIYRLADWVAPVRQAAMDGIKNYLNISYIDSLIHHLPLFEWVRRTERTDIGPIYHEIIDFIVKSNRNYIISNYKKYPEKLRLILAKHISSTLNNNSIELGLLLADKNFLIRKLTLHHFDKLGKNEIHQLLLDKSSTIRLETLYHLKNSIEFTDTIQLFLADPSGTIRSYARAALSQFPIHFEARYLKNLNEGKQIIGSLCGLAEIQSSKFPEIVEHYLDYPVQKVRKAAFIALCKVDREKAYPYAIANLGTDYIGLRRRIIDYLSTIPRQEVLEKARASFQNGDNHLKASMLNLFSLIGNWVALPDLMLGTISEEENLRLLSCNYLLVWQKRATNMYTKPTSKDLERANKVFQYVFETHETKQYFKTNPVAGLDFYFSA